jgi:hypothetical protein
VPEENDPKVQEAWDLIVNARMEVCRTFDKTGGRLEKEVRLEGIVQSCRYDSSLEGKQIVFVVDIECSDARWQITEDMQSPYHVFVERRVMVSGEPYEPESLNRRLWRVGEKPIGYFRVSTMRLVEATPDAWLIEVGAEQQLSGRLERATGDAGESALSFVTDKGDTFLVANDPAGAIVGRRDNVLVYPVLPSPSLPRSSQPHLWVICPHSYKDLWESSRRPNAGLPRDLYVDAESGQIRRRQVSAEPGTPADRPRD